MTIREQVQAGVRFHACKQCEYNNLGDCELDSLSKAPDNCPAITDYEEWSSNTQK